MRNVITLAGSFLALVCLCTSAAMADPIPSGWTCTGACGSDGADGVVPLSPLGTSAYSYITTAGGAVGIGVIPTGALGGETDGSLLTTSTFSATAGTDLNFYFDYVTSDGSSIFSDYAWAALINTADDSVAAILFTARTEPSPTNIVPGVGLPPSVATLTPSSVPIQPGTTWSPLGSYSGDCYQGVGNGCGNSGWVNSDYTIAASGTYALEFGVTNYADLAFDSGLAIDGVTVGGVPLNSTPEPSSYIFLATGLVTLGGMVRRKLKV